MQKKRLIVALLLVFALLFSTSVLAANCCLDKTSDDFCKDVLSTSICSFVLKDVSCANSDFCFSDTIDSCCLDECSSGKTGGVSSPLLCSDPSTYVREKCSQYTLCQLGCAFCDYGTSQSWYDNRITLRSFLINPSYCPTMLEFNTSLTSCLGVPAPTFTSTYSVSGRITDASSGSALGGVTVNIAGISVSSSTDGTYTIIGVPYGSFTVRATSINHYESKITLIVDGQDKSDVNLQLTPLPTATLQVTVKDGQNNNVKDASVTPSGFTSIMTDAQGKATFTNLPTLFPNGLKKNYSVKAIIGVSQTSANIVLTQNPTLLTLIIPYIANGTIIGTISNSSGQVVPGVSVSMLSRTSITNSSGGYELLQVPVGPQSLTIHPPLPYTDQFPPVLVEQDKVKTYNFVLSRTVAEASATLNITVRDSSNNVVPGALVEIMQADAVPLSFMTNDQGKVQTQIMKNFDYTVRVTKDGYQQYTTSVNIAVNYALPINLIDSVGVTLSGYITDSTSTDPIQGVEVTLYGGPLPTAPVTSDIDGFYSISGIVPSLLSSYYIHAAKPNYHPYSPLAPFFLSQDRQFNFSMAAAECSFNIDPPQILQLKLEKNRTKITFESSCPVTGYYIYRCEGNGCTNFKPITNILPFSADQFTDLTIKPGKWYTYQVRSVFERPFVTTKISDNMSIYTGAKECFDLLTDEFCYQNTMSECDVNNTIQEVFGSEEFLVDERYCLQNGEKTKYVNKIDCAIDCNKPLGMFSIFGVFTILDPSEINYNCSNSDIFSSLAYCYQDYAQTAVSRYFSCSEITSCYDYDSEESCVENSCGFGGTEECEWNSYSPDLRLGVCRPKEKQYWNCSKCDEFGKFNDLFGACNANICPLYGEDYCFFYSDKNKCLPQKELSCEYYLNEAQCENGDGPVEVDINSKNKILHKSDDLLSFGLCRFGSPSIPDPYWKTHCFKDANNDLLRDPNAKDMIVPFTSVVHPTAVKSISFPVVVYDDENDKTSSTTYAQTYFQMTKGSFVRPNILATSGTISTAYLNESNRNYTIWFYSKDDAHNLEVVKNFSVYVDFIAPDTVFNYYYSKYTESNMSGMVALTATLSSTETLRCTANLYDENNDLVEGGNIVDEINTAFLSSYDIRDGVYYYNYQCTDWVGNSVSDSRVIIIDTENMIYDFQPNSTLKDSVVTLSVRTRAQANCKYIDADNEPDGTFDIFSLEDISYTDPRMKDFSTSDGFYHYSSQSITQPSIAKKYFVRCRLSSTSQLTNSTVAAIRFTVDRLAPNTTFYEGMYASLNPLAYDFSSWRNLANIIVNCTDPQSPTFLPNQYYTPREFGCNALKYCVNYGYCTPNASSVAYLGPQGQMLWKNTTGVQLIFNETKQVCYQSVDKGGNQEPENCRLIIVDTKPPRVNIESRTGICIDNFAGTNFTVCRVRDPIITLNGTVDNVAFWSDKGGSLSYFRDFYMTATIQTNNISTIIFDELGTGSYHYVEFNLINTAAKTITYGAVGNTVTQVPVVPIANRVPFNITINATGTTARIYINGVLQGSFSRLNREGWIRTDNFSISNILIVDENLTSPLTEYNLAVYTDVNLTGQNIAINPDDTFDADVNLGPLLEKFVSEGMVELKVEDEAGNIGSAGIWVVIDRQGPTVSPTFDPPVDNTLNSFGENYDKLGYRLHYIPPPENIYYLGSELYLSGFTAETGMRLELLENETTTIATYQEPSNLSYKKLGAQLTVAFERNKGENQITVSGQQAATINQITGTKYITVSGHHRIKYGHYGDAYTISNVQESSGDTIITVAEPLEAFVAQGEKIIIANSSRPPNRFMIDTNLDFSGPYGETRLRLRQFDDLNNSGASSNILHIIYDTIPPENRSVIPKFHEGVLNYLSNITVDVVEKGSGLRRDNVVFKVNGVDKKGQLVITETKSPTPDANGIFTYFYRLYYNFGTAPDGDYFIDLKVTDKANNPLAMNWSLTKDSTLPRNPVWNTTNYALIEIAPDGYWFMNKVPIVQANYIELNKPAGIINITNAVLRRTRDGNKTVSDLFSVNCVRSSTSDVFACTLNMTDIQFRDGNYQLELTTRKYFADGKRSGPKLDIFYFTRDREVPSVTNFTVINQYMQSDGNLSFYAYVKNEYHPVKVNLSLIDPSNLNKEYSLFTDADAGYDYFISGTTPQEVIDELREFGLNLQNDLEYPIKLVVADYGGNVNDSERDSVIIDDVPPTLFSDNIVIDATPIYRYIFQDLTGNAGSTVYIISEDIVQIYGTIPPDVVDLTAYRLAVGEDDLISKIRPCVPSQPSVYCVNNNTGEFHMAPSNTFQFGELGEVINNLVRIVATDRAGNTAQITKYLYSDLQTPTIVICTGSLDCTGNITEETPAITDPDEILSKCDGDTTLCHILISAACSDSNDFAGCYVDYVAEKMDDPELYELCLLPTVGVRAVDCIKQLALDTCTTGVCKYLEDLDASASRPSCEAAADKTKGCVVDTAD